ncbi:MAG: molybdenum cofactor guanylyltransferase MobA [Alphaproteobacteria bacterium]|nr:molybdenum cofactor guanylyltransferase MobA [Alphaproteobacteria bacterium]
MPPVIGVLLAGGLSRRMGGGDKTLLELGGKPILSHVIARLSPQVDAVILNANGDPSRFASYGLPVVPDVIEGFAGPLAGVLTGLDYARAHHPEAAWIVTAATDAPFLPRDLVARLTEAAEDAGADLACASSGGRAHPVIGLWPVRLAEDLRSAMADGVRKVDIWTARHRLVEVPFATDPVDPFFNANRPDDLAEAERLLAELENA